MTDKLLSVQDVAEYLSVSDETVRRRIAEGKFPAYQVGRQLRLRLDEVLEALRYVTHAADEFERLSRELAGRYERSEPRIAEAFEVVAGGPLHGTTLLADEPEALLGGLTLAEALQALSVRFGCKYRRFDWRDDIYLCPCGMGADELELAERSPRFAVTLQQGDTK